ncbi:MAG: hypothetical protein UHD04_05590 [Muribaculaceae bacterium]|nr:hypothetical protein [Muribaculaceae bacterium]MEE1338399.1 hypothetical protein [Muribaculaceae bacterium]
MRRVSYRIGFPLERLCANMSKNSLLAESGGRSYRTLLPEPRPMVGA